MVAKLQAMLRWPRDWWLSHHHLDLLIVALLIVGHRTLVWRFDLPVPLGSVPLKNRPGLYSASALAISLSGTIASLAVGQFLGAKGTRARYLKTRHPDELAGTWRAIFYGSILAAGLILMAYGLDARYTDKTAGDLGPSLGAWIFEAAAVLALLRLIRLVTLFGDLVDIIVRDEVEPIGGDPVEFTDDFFAEPQRGVRGRTE